MTAELDSLRTALADRYAIDRELGQGGMATVYLAHDLRHERDVAVKVLHEDLGAALGPERFLAEIKTTAKLQHPHILPLLDSGSAGARLFYVMPFIAGETLRDRLTRDTQLPLEDAVRIAREVADALGYAHGHGIIHRDIKPENILLQGGHALVADFGIALAVQHAGSQRMTQTGLSLGTPQYMSPEQAMGEKNVDHHADIYALGAVTYEMLTGDPPFTGSSVQAVVSKVLSAEPQRPTLTRKTIPPNVEAAVLTALAKLPADRFASAADFAAALVNPSVTTTARAAVHSAPASGRRAWIVGGAMAVLALGAGLMIGRRGDDAGSVGRNQVIRATLALGDSAVVRGIGNLRLAIAPTGERIAFVGADGAELALWIREFNQPDARKLPDTKGGFGPFFSPDGQSVGFFANVGGKTVMKVTTVAGGVSRVVVSDSVSSFGGASWADDGQIYFTNSNHALVRVAQSGGRVTVIARPDSTSGVQELDFPDVLPGNRRALVMLWMGSIGVNKIGVVDLATGAVTDLTAGTFARFAKPAFLLVGTADNRILAAPFDVAKGRLKGPPVPMLQNVQNESANGTLQFAISGTGTLVYEPLSGGTGTLMLVDRDGRRTPVDTTLLDVGPSIAFSPDGSQIALLRGLSGDQQIWVKQLATGALSRLSFGFGSPDRPVWTTDGRRVAFIANRNGRRTSWVRRADGSDSAQAAVPGSTKLDEIAFDPLGRYTLLRSEGTGPNTRHLLVVKNGVDTAPRPLVPSQFDNFAMTLSPNGQWLAYVSNESGSGEVYVRPFPSVDSARFVVSVGGGSEPVWRRDGTELFFRNSRGDMLVVPVNTGRSFVHGTPKLLFAAPGLAMQDYYRAYDIHPDGKRFLMVTSGGTDAHELSVIFNWRTELTRLENPQK
jgi:serine/threonine-protein kinase